MKKVIIEFGENSKLYAIMFVDLSDLKAYVKYYDGINEVDSIEQGIWKQYSQSLAKKAEETCKANGWQFWSY